MRGLYTRELICLGHVIGLRTRIYTELEHYISSVRARIFTYSAQKESMAAKMNTAQMQKRKTSDAIEWDDLLLKVTKEHFGRRARLLPSFYTQRDKKAFLAELFNDAKNINPREPEEISKNTVDVNEKIYCNSEGNEDTSTVKIINSVENSEGHNYQETVTKGVQWGANANVGLQFGLPHVGVGVKAGVGTSFQRQSMTSIVKETKKENRVELQAHHEETVKIPPGKKVIVKMISYRVRYKLDYTMEYKISKSTSIRVKVDSCGLGIAPFCASIGVITASQLIQLLPGYREDDEFVYFTQEGELRWIADRMEVKKTTMDM